MRGVLVLVCCYVPVLMRFVMAGEIMASSKAFGLALFSVTLYVTDTPEPGRSRGGGVGKEK